MKPALLALLLAACTSQQPIDKEAPAPSAVLTGRLQRHMKNCPSAIPTAETQPIRTQRGIDLAITANDPVAQRAITAATDLHVGRRDRRWFAVPHTGFHGGPGTVGHCPIIHANTYVSYEPISRGVLIHVVARNPAMVETLQQATLSRIEDLQTPSI